MKKLYTAYNKDVQKYMTGNELSSSRKSVIIEKIEKMVVAAGESFERLFPVRSKRKDVMDHVIYLLSGNGICKIAATTLADKADCSVRTVNTAVNALKKTGEVLVAGLADGKNKYVFVLKSHENFQAILKDVFYINSEQITEHFAGQVAEQKNVESLGTVGVEGEKTSSNNINSFNSLITKQEKDIIKDSIECELKSEENGPTQYYVNPFQEILYDTIKNHSYHAEIKKNASVLGLRLGSNATKAYLNLSLQAVTKIDRFLYRGGTVDESIPAMFTKMYQDLIKYAAKPAVKTANVASYPLINWLDEDLSKQPIQVKEINYTIPKDDFKLSKEEADEMGLF
ncbi:cytosolic protein [Peribacillus sp. TH24]|uniref:cytosolic protein n=1 Tax=Peribacillus sp. TH24 TaxID=2798483 RepID=UPI001912BF48|nr:cytosolic protein [Peribacillus sp. TH24]MBK5446080.1 cytosolic protein [Peribacillus sp. TH24]